MENGYNLRYTKNGGFNLICTDLKNWKQCLHVSVSIMNVQFKIIIQNNAYM